MRGLMNIAVLIASSAVYIWLARRLGIEREESILFLPLLWALPLFMLWGRNFLERGIRSFYIRIGVREKETAKLSEKMDSEKKEKRGLEQELAELSRFYGITKEMSSDMRFAELSDSIRKFLEENLKFTGFEILIFRGVTGSGKKAEKVCDIESPGHGDGKSGQLIIPLVMRGRVIGTVTVKGAEKSDYYKFSILASQIALQIERIRLFDEVERLSLIDGLTGVFLRRYFLERFDEEMSRARESGMGLSVIIADLDRFKRCNDEFGHLVGDAVLREVARTVKKNVREIDLVARLGGEEFCVLLPETGKGESLAAAERIRSSVENRIISAYDEKLSITLSMGLATFPEDGSSGKALMEKADRALYEAKRSGRNRVCAAPAKS